MAVQASPLQRKCQSQIKAHLNNSKRVQPTQKD